MANWVRVNDSAISTDDYEDAEEISERELPREIYEKIADYIDMCARDGEATHFYKGKSRGRTFYDIDCDPFFTGTFMEV